MNKNHKIQLITTDEGSHTLLRTDTGEIYHSRHGALQESLLVFIKNGFRHLSHLQQINLFEAGFGTGLNALLTCMESNRQQIQTHYDAIELYPLPTDLVTKLNYPVLLNDTEGFFQKIHLAPWDEETEITSWFILRKINKDLTTYSPGKQYNLIYFDAFSPDVQPELWTPEIFRNLAGCLTPQGILVTYSAKSSVRKTLQTTGFETEKLPGPPGKREMIRAMKI